MNTRNVELEVVDYRTEELVNTSWRLVSLYARYSSIPQAIQWLESWPELRTIIKDQRNQRFSLRGEGVIVSFSGHSAPIPKIKEDGSGIVFRPRDPSFIIEENVDDLLPSQRFLIYEFNQAIVREMHSTYHMRVDTNPLTLTFPKEEYAKNVSLFNASLIISDVSRN